MVSSVPFLDRCPAPRRRADPPWPSSRAGRFAGAAAIVAAHAPLPCDRAVPLYQRVSPSSGLPPAPTRCACHRRAKALPFLDQESCEHKPPSCALPRLPSTCLCPIVVRMLSALCHCHGCAADVLPAHTTVGLAPVLPDRTSAHKARTHPRGSCSICLTYTRTHAREWASTPVQTPQFLSLCRPAPPCCPCLTTARIRMSPVPRPCACRASRGCPVRMPAHARLVPPPRRRFVRHRGSLFPVRPATSSPWVDTGQGRSFLYHNGAPAFPFVLRVLPCPTAHTRTRARTHARFPHVFA
jgi:hypothetical protein